MKQEVVLALFRKLKKCKYSNGKMRKFKNLVHKLELKLRCRKTNVGGIIKYNITPLEFFIKSKKLSSRYIIAKNTLKKFTIIRGTRSITSIKLIPLHINNLVHHKSHLNLLVILGKRIFRIDPTSPSKTKIKTKNVNKTLSKYSIKRGMIYSGMYSRNKIIKHGGLCRYVTPLVYVYGKSLNHRIIKKEIISYFKFIISQIYP